VEQNQHENEIETLAVFLPIDMIQREAQCSFEFVEEDIKTVHDACVKAWAAYCQYKMLGA
jgi:hypothetical protein